ncbi:MAG TPA: hypothetical protein V6D18_08115 [Thermosynechococcaceae cyanobacterium]
MTFPKIMQWFSLFCSQARSASKVGTRSIEATNFWVGQLTVRLAPTKLADPVLFLEVVANIAGIGLDSLLCARPHPCDQF